MGKTAKAQFLVKVIFASTSSYSEPGIKWFIKYLIEEQVLFENVSIWKSFSFKSACFSVQFPSFLPKSVSQSSSSSPSSFASDVGDRHG